MTRRPCMLLPLLPFDETTGLGEMLRDAGQGDDSGGGAGILRRIRFLSLFYKYGQDDVFRWSVERGGVVMIGTTVVDPKRGMTTETLREVEHTSSFSGVY